MTDRAAPAHRVVFVTVNYRRERDTRDFVESVAALTGFVDCRVVVVDNASCEESRGQLGSLADRFSRRVTVLSSEVNRYYWRGAAWGLAEIYGTSATSLPEWVVVCNNDILIEQSDFVERLLRCDPEEGAVVGPSILGPDGLDQNPFLLRPHGPGARIFWSIYHAHFGLARALLAMRALVLPLRRRTDSRRHAGAGPVYAVHGAFVCISRRFFEAGGFLDDGFDLFAEELTLAETARRLGLPVVFEPVLQVRHRDHGSSGAAALTRWAYDHHRRGWRHFIRKYRSPVRPGRVPRREDTV